MSSRPANAWIVLAAWLGLMLGVGAALRPQPPTLLHGDHAAGLASRWAPALVSRPPGRAALLLGTPCPCDGDARRTVSHWARAANVEVREMPGLPGIALADGDGRLRYAGDASALLSLCGGTLGFRRWWVGVPDRPVLTVPCACV